VIAHRENRRVLLRDVPAGPLTPDHFTVETAPVPQRAAGEAIVRTRFLGIDAGARAWLQSATYRTRLAAGELMPGTGLAEVIDPGQSGLSAGDLVVCETGWQDYALVPVGLLGLPRYAEPPTHLLSVYGNPGLTAFFGMIRSGQPARGETVVVSAAAGAVGSLAGQLARMRGCRVLGIVGGAGKAQRIVDELGFHGALDYRAGDLRGQLKAAAPDGVHLYFDNVGGEVLETVLLAMAAHGRIVCCGAVSQYDGPAPAHGPRGVPGLLITRRLQMLGFLVSDFDADRAVGVEALETAVRSGELKVPEDIVEGLANAPAALAGVLAGDNFGRRIVKV
jgi:NADPH-dependent curcumin reductase CurA